MASKSCLRALRHLAINPWVEVEGPVIRKHRNLAYPRAFASVAHDPIVADTTDGSTTSKAESKGLTTSVTLPLDASTQQPPNTVLATIYSFPSMAPREFAYYPNDYLHLPLRRDILQRAVVFEGDRTRQGTASTKWRDEVHGSHHKHHPQKGSGRARAGDKQSPIFRGGGVAFGPKPRDFSTKLPRKIYDKAWRTALSYRYRKGQLVVVDKVTNFADHDPTWMRKVFDTQGWGNEDGRSLVLVDNYTKANGKFKKGMDLVGETGRMLSVEEVDVKALLEMGRIIIEYNALNRILQERSTDLVPPSEIVNMDILQAMQHKSAAQSIST